MIEKHGEYGWLTFDKRWTPQQEQDLSLEGIFFVNDETIGKDCYFLPFEQEYISQDKVTAYQLASEGKLLKGLTREIDSRTGDINYVTEKTPLSRVLLYEELNDRMLDFMGFSKFQEENSRLGNLTKNNSSISPQTLFEGPISTPLDVFKGLESFLGADYTQIAEFHDDLREIVLQNPGISTDDFEKLAWKKYELHGFEEGQLNNIILDLEIGGQSYVFPPEKDR